MRITIALLFLVVGGCATFQGPGQPPPSAPAADVRDEPDVVQMRTGETLTGRVIAESDERIVLAQRYGTFTLAKRDVVAVSRGQRRAARGSSLSAFRLPSLADVTYLVAQRRWGSDLHQIPATVIDTGILKNVPYISHRAGHFEINVYGDPDSPAGVEIGTSRPSEEDYRELRDVMSAMLARPADRELLYQLKLTGEARETDGLTIEITPATAPDAYGAWWISAYSTRDLDAARASETEIQQIAEVPPPPPPPTSAPLISADWTSDESVTAVRKSTTGTVYVKGYYRKNGTYVRPHTRRR